MIIDEKFLHYAKKCADKCNAISSAKDIEEYLESEDIDICEVFSAAGYYLEKFITEFKKQNM